MPNPEHKTERLAFRLPADTAAKWRKLAAEQNLSLSDFVRGRVDSGSIKHRKRKSFVAADPALLRQIAMLGNNLNQIARYVNEKKSAADTFSIVARLIQIRNDLDKLLPQDGD